MKPSIPRFTPEGIKAKLVAIFDIDSTLADNDHRAELLEEYCVACLHRPFPKDVPNAECINCGGTSAKITQESFDAFLEPELLAKDPLIPGALKVLEKLRSHDVEIHFITGRNEKNTGDVTKAWLRDHVGWDSSKEKLMMRQQEDSGLSASLYKERALQRLHKEADLEGALLVFFEDDPHVFNVYNKYGIVIQCPHAWDLLIPEGASAPERALRR